MSIFKALVSGVVGAGTLTLAHLLTQKMTRNAPRMDVLGERAISGGMKALGLEPPAEESLYPAALAGDLVVNSAYFAMVGLPRPDAAPACGLVLGLLAGLGAVALPGPLGLGTAPSSRTASTQAMTIGLYLLGGLAAGLTHRALATETRG